MSLSALSSVPRALTSVRSSSASAFCRSSPIALSGIWSSFLMMLATLASIASSSPGMVGSCDRLSATSRPSPAARRGRSRTRRTAPRSAGCPMRSCARTPCATRLSISFRRTASRSAPGAQVDDLDAEPLRVEADRHRRGELEGLRVDLRADLGDLADRDAAELDRRAGREPAHRFLEDEHVGLRIAGGQLEGLGAVAEQGEDACPPRPAAGPDRSRASRRRCRRSGWRAATGSAR